jgi:hypothetical protein
MAPERDARLDLVEGRIAADRVDEPRFRVVGPAHGGPRRALASAALALAGAGCAGPLSALDPAGPAAATIATLWWIMFVGAVLVVGLVSGAGRSRDVIHSFWVPRLAGKVDAIPGRTTVLRLEARAGVCAELHARHGFEVDRPALHRARAFAPRGCSSVIGGGSCSRC